MAWVEFSSASPCVHLSLDRNNRAYLLKERLHDVFRAGEDVPALLDSWLASACRCRTKGMPGLSREVRRHRERILRSIALRVSNARVEAVNNKIKLTIRTAYGLRNIDNLIALVMPRYSNLPVALPGRAF